MDPEEAKVLLLAHSGLRPDIEDPKIEKAFQEGFLGSLRPYRGLKEQNYHEVMEAIRALAPHLQAAGVVDKEIVSALWHICWQASLLGLHSLGALQRNHLISPEDIERLEEWVFDISFAVSMLLEGNGVDQAFANYEGRPSC